MGQKPVLLKPEDSVTSFLFTESICMHVCIQIFVGLLLHICGFYVYVEAAHSVLVYVIHVFMIKLISISAVNDPNLVANSIVTEVLYLKQGL